MNLNPFGLLVFLLACIGSNAKADLNTYKIFSVEYLVDNCDAILIARFDGEAADSKPQIFQMIKGDSSDIQWPIVPQELDMTFLSSTSKSKLRLLFVRGRSELVYSVDLARRKDINSGLNQSIYGVTQFGELLMTESSLFRCIDERLRVERKPQLTSRRNYKIASQASVVLGNAAEDFPLNNDSEIHCLVVPCDVARRDHFLQLLETGDAGEKNFAIQELAALRDDQAEAAVRTAIHCEVARTVYRHGSLGDEISECNVQTVRDAAVRAARFIAQDPERN